MYLFYDDISKDSENLFETLNYEEDYFSLNKKNELITSSKSIPRDACSRNAKSQKRQPI